MPIQRCTLKSGSIGWKWGTKGKCYASRADAIKQMKAILASGYKEPTANAAKPRRNPLRADPSRTATLRRLFEQELRRRFKRVAKLLDELVVGEDVFGLTREVPIMNARWVFHTKAEQVAMFLKWIAETLGVEVLNRVDEAAQAQKDAYWRRFVEEAYKKGQGRAFDDVRKPELQEDMGWYKGTRDEFLRSSFGRPMSIEKVQLMAGRVFTDLKGVTQSMATVMSRELVDGFARGDNPHTLARRLKDELDMGSNRAATIARTEVLRAHVEGQLDALEAMGIEKVGVMVEWDTAGDGRVCRLCSAMQGTVLTLKEMRGMLPRHPNCRCVPVPANVGEPTKDQVRQKAKIEAAIDRSLMAEKPKKRTLAQQRKRTKWAGADKTIAKKRPVSVLNYNPSQPRDDHGRWGSGGAKGSLLSQEIPASAYMPVRISREGAGPEGDRLIESLETCDPEVKSLLAS